MALDLNQYLFKAMTVERPTRMVRDKLRANGYLLVGEHGCFGDQLWVHSSHADKTRQALGLTDGALDPTLDIGNEYWWGNCTARTWSSRNRLRLAAEVMQRPRAGRRRRL